MPSHKRLAVKLSYCFVASLGFLAILEFFSAGASQLDSQGTPGLYLVVSFWAPSLKPVAHRSEVEAAIVLNIANEHISAVHVAFEASEGYRCGHVERRFSLLLRKARLTKRGEFNCENHFSRALSYYDMFATAKGLETDENDRVVILANADMVFDSSIRHLAKLHPDILAVISTRGFGPLGPRKFQNVYRRLHEKPVQTTINRCYDLSSGEGGGCRGSWDAFAFRPSRLTLSYDAFLDEKTQAPFVMHQNGAEPAALNALMIKSKFSEARQLCDHVKMWHLHSENKTHYNSSELSVFHLYSFPVECATLTQCLRHPRIIAVSSRNRRTRARERCNELHIPFRERLNAVRKEKARRETESV